MKKIPCSLQKFLTVNTESFSFLYYSTFILQSYISSSIPYILFSNANVSLSNKNFIVLLKTDLFKQISFQAASKNTCRRQVRKFLPVPVCRYFYYVYIFIMFIFLSRIIFHICIPNPHIKTLHTFSRFSRITICCGQASSHSIPPVILVITRRQIRSQ